MPASPADRQSVWFGIAALAIVFFGIAEWRALRVAGTPAAAQQVAALPPGSDVADVLSYLTPDTAAQMPVLTRAPEPVALVRDPFGPSEASRAVLAGGGRGTRVTPSGRSSDWTVNAVLITPSYRAAIINDVLVQLGGALSDGTKLTAVERDHVVLTDSKGARRKIDIKEGA